MGKDRNVLIGFGKMIRRWKRAVVEMGEVFLWWVENGEEVEPIPWPDNWPKRVSYKFLREQGFFVFLP